MRILFTGSSSFTGYWFVKRLAERGHEVVATLRSPVESYQGVRGERVRRLAPVATLVSGIAFGSTAMVDLIRQGGPWDLMAHHGADVTDYKSPDFDPVRALQSNSHRIAEVVAVLKEQGCNHLLLTGSLFEQREGRERGPAFSPYGLSKGLTSDLFDYYAHRAGLRFGKFVIPNPFGPFEEPRFTAYLVRSWFEERVARVATPDYVRDNIHVSLLAAAYADFAERLMQSEESMREGPSGYAESQGAFAGRFSKEMASRLQIPCPLELGVQTDFSEPVERTNTDAVDQKALGWDERKAWDELAGYYREVFLG